MLFHFFSLTVVQTPVMASLQVENIKKEMILTKKRPFSVQSAAQADPVQQTTEGYNYEVNKNYFTLTKLIHNIPPGT